jgi:hypothetical protein
MSEHTASSVDHEAPTIPKATGYKRLVLTKRSVTANNNASQSSRSSIFGSAKPREQVLKEKGIDVKEVEKNLDKRIQRLPRMNESQQEVLNEMDAQLSSANKRAAAEDASVDDKASAEVEVLKLTEERAAFIDKLRKEEIDFARKRRLEADKRTQESPSYRSSHRPNSDRGDNQRYDSRSPPARQGYESNHDQGYNNFGNQRNRGYNNQRKNDNNNQFSNNYNNQFSNNYNNQRNNNNDADFANFSSNRSRGQGYSNSNETGRNNYQNSRDSQSFRSRDDGKGDNGNGNGNNDGATLFVGQLNYVTNEDTLRNVFSKFGMVTRCKIVMSRDAGQSRGFAFVSFNNAESAQSALSMGGQMVDGRAITTRIAD